MITQPLPIASSPVPSSDDPYLIVGQEHTPATIDIECEPDEAPLEAGITSSHSTAPSDSTTPLFLDHLPTQTTPNPMLSRPLYYHRTACMAVRTQPTMSHGLSARVTKAMNILPSSFRKRYKSSYEIPSPSSLASSPTLPVRKRYRGTSELIKYTESESLESGSEREGSEDKGHDSKEEEAAPEGQPQQAVQGLVPSTFEIGHSSRSVPEQQRVEVTLAPRPPVRATWVDPVDGILYTDIPIYVPRVRVPVQTPPSPEWSSGSLPVSLSSLIVPTLVASPADSSPVASPVMVEAERFLSELGAQVELQGGTIHDYTQRLDALPPVLFEGYDRDLRELYTLCNNYTKWMMPLKKTTTPMTDAAIKELIAQCIADALAEYEANKSSGNGDDGHDSRSGRRRTEHTIRECTYSDFLKCQPFKFKGTE
nr:hypothetical protein [Tanacetum cinerariifolium]